MSATTTPAGLDPERPHSHHEILHWVESGRISSETALRHLQERQLEPWHSKSSPAVVPDRAEMVLKDFDALVGLNAAKRLVREMRAFIAIQRSRQECGLKAEGHMLHMIFKGAPGTGKTTVARLLGRLFEAMDVLPKGQLVEAERADLVGEYIGHTAQKTRELIKRAMGGILFVDEAYALARGGSKDFGKEAIDTLVKAMEDHKNQWVLILAGYPREMDVFLESNPGLRSRFAVAIDFPDYTATELLAIARHMVRDRQYYLQRDAELRLLQYFDSRQHSWHMNAGNARMVRNLLEKAVRRQSVRLLQKGGPWTRDDLMQLQWVDFEEGC